MRRWHNLLNRRSVEEPILCAFRIFCSIKGYRMANLNGGSQRSFGPMSDWDEPGGRLKDFGGDNGVETVEGLEVHG